jgi:hypothetical protein
MKFSNIFLTNQSANTASQTVGIELDDQALESVSGGCAQSTFNSHSNHGHTVVEHENFGSGNHGYHQPSFHPCPPPRPLHHQKRHF